MHVTEKSSGKWLALRQLHEGAAADAERLATVAGLKPHTVRKRAKAEGWINRNPPVADRSRRLSKLADRLIDHAEQIGDDGEGSGGMLDKSRIEAVAAMTRTIEKIGEITRGAEAAREEQAKRDEDVRGSEQARRGAVGHVSPFCDVHWAFSRPAVEKAP